jgi:hypothetical protein
MTASYLPRLPDGWRFNDAEYQWEHARAPYVVAPYTRGTRGGWVVEETPVRRPVWFPSWDEAIIGADRVADYYYPQGALGRLVGWYRRRRFA